MSSDAVAEQQQNTDEHHVHFDQSTIHKDEFETENCVTYQKIGDKIVVVHLGFLQINHRYLIELKLPIELIEAESIILVPDTSTSELTTKITADDYQLASSSKSSTSTQNNNNNNVDIDITNNINNNNNIENNFNTHCKLIEFNGKKEEITDNNKNTNEFFYYMKVEYFAHKEKLLKEELKLINAKNSEELLKLIMTARVLGKGKGTPMLRNGIHCIGIEGGLDGDGNDEDELSTFHLENSVKKNSV